MSIKKILAAVMTAGMMMSFIPTTSLADSAGWYKDDNGWKYYTYEDGFLKSTWKKIGGKWYFFSFTGYMVSDASNFEVGDELYDFSSSGECLNPDDGKTWFSPGWNKVSYTVISSTSDYSDSYIKTSWLYVDSDGEISTGWKNIGGKWYYFHDPSGEMVTGMYGLPVYINSSSYYLKEGSGEMLTGWINSGTNWFYANPSGESYGKIYFNQWLNSGGKWYYFDHYGRMIYNAVNYKIGDIYYSFDSDGACVDRSGTTDLGTGWVKRSTTFNSYSWSYIDEQGNEYEGWKKIDGAWYYFSNGIASVGTAYIDKRYYYFDDNGKMLTGWVKTSNDHGTYWHYAGADGASYHYRWVYSGGKWYFIDFKNLMVSDVDNYLIDGKYYSFDSNGVCKNPSGETGMITGWFKYCTSWDPGNINYYWYYYDSNGNMYKDKWLSYSGKWYYFDKYGVMVTFLEYEIDDKIYDFDKNGACMNPNNPRQA